MDDVLLALKKALGDDLSKDDLVLIARWLYLASGSGEGTDALRLQAERELTSKVRGLRREVVWTLMLFAAPLLGSSSIVVREMRKIISGRDDPKKMPVAV